VSEFVWRSNIHFILRTSSENIVLRVIFLILRCRRTRAIAESPNFFIIIEFFLFTDLAVLVKFRFFAKLRFFFDRKINGRITGFASTRFSFDPQILSEGLNFYSELFL